MRDIIKQTFIVVNTLALIETILSLNQTTRNLNRKQKSFRKKRNSVTNSCQSRDKTKRESLSEKEY